VFWDLPEAGGDGGAGEQAGAVADCEGGKQEGKCSFLKKRTKKLLPLAYGSGEPRTNSQKFFASFFQKRRPSSFGHCEPLGHRALA
jgi:hypothetical protein